MHTLPVQALALSFVISIAAGVAAAQTYPAKPVRLIVPFAAGGTTDIVARFVGQKLSQEWNQTVVVENRTGASGNLGAAEVAKAPADGYTLLMVSGSVVTANQHIYAAMPFSAQKDLAPITTVASGPQVIVVHPNFPAKTLRELIDLAKAKPNSINYGHSGIGSQVHLAGESFLFSAGIEMAAIPYRGEAPAIADVVAGQTNAAVPNLAGAIGFINAGKLRALAVTSRERSPSLPNVPTVSETLRGFENAGWFGLMAPAGTPRTIIDKVYADTSLLLKEGGRINLTLRRVTRPSV